MTQSKEMKRLSEAVRCYQAGEISQAEKLAKQLTRQVESRADGLHLLGLIANKAGDNHQAVDLLQKAVALQPGKVDFQYNLGVVLQEQERLDEAEQCYRRVLQLSDRHAGAINNLAVILAGNSRHEEAATWFKRALELDETVIETRTNLGGELFKLDQVEEALACFDHVLARQPDFVRALKGKATALYKVGHCQAALECSERAIQLRPDYAEAHYMSALSLLAMGRYKEGWAAYKWRTKLDFFRREMAALPYPEWDGTPLNERTLLVYCEQGAGDAIQFIRYLSRPGVLDGRVLLLCDRTLHSLFQAVGGIARLIDKATGEVVDEPVDCFVRLLDLPRVLALDEPGLAGPVPYLAAPADKVAHFKRQLLSAGDGDLRVGLVWAGNPDHGNDHNRSMALDVLAVLGAIPGVTYFSLQKGKIADQANHPPAGLKLVNLDPAIQDFSDTAAIIENLDLVICVDTSVAHLAGALGKPVWVMLPVVETDWRWQREGESCPWYPSMRVFRQTQAGSWKEPVAQVQHKLSEWAASRASKQPLAGPGNLAGQATPADVTSDPGHLQETMQAGNHMNDGIAPQALQRVLVLASEGVYDRLGYHLVNQALPPQVMVCYANLATGPYPEGVFDLTIIGTGGPLSHMTDLAPLLATLDRSRQAIGLFSLSPHWRPDHAGLNILLDRLAIWFAGSHKDILHNGKNRANAIHFGNWLTTAFPMTEPVRPETIEVAGEVWLNAPDLVIREIQSFHRVVSSCPAALLCSLASATEVAFTLPGDRPEAGEEMRVLLEEVLAIHPLEGQLFAVDRARVIAYRQRMHVLTKELQAAIATMLEC